MRSAPLPCPGSHNNRWRAAEAAEQPHELAPTWGDPVHCLGCQAKAFQQLAELPELLAAIWLEAVHGTRSRPDTTTMRPSGNAPWPGQASRLLTDLIVGGLVALEDDIRDLRHLGHRPARGIEGQTATGAVNFLQVHLSWALEFHPAASEPFDRDSANPASQIATWHRTAERFTKRDSLRIQLTAPCPRCALRTLARADGEEYVECCNAACGTLLTEHEYAVHAGETAAEEKARRAA